MVSEDEYKFSCFHLKNSMFVASHTKLFLMLMMLIYTDLEIWPKLQVYMELVLQDAQIAQDIYFWSAHVS